MKNGGAIAALIMTATAGLPQNAARMAFEHYQAGSKAFVEQRFEAAIEALNKVAPRNEHAPASRGAADTIGARRPRFSTIDSELARTGADCYS